MLPIMLDLATVRGLYGSGKWTVEGLFDALATRIDAGDPAMFITRTPRENVAHQIAALLARAPVPNSLPLWGIPFAVKDNIDCAGLPTTAACPAFAHVPDMDATVVAKLKAAGAIVIGKTNLDQFATGLNGTRSPYGIPRSVFDLAYISGGSSSGSAVAVGSGIATFSLGTDTAGSGRVPAAFNNIVGIKPTPGLFSSLGMVPACRSLDCISIFAATVGDGAEVRRLAEGFDPADPYSQRAKPAPLPVRGLRVGILRAADRQFFGDSESARLYDEAIANIEGSPVEIDFAPFRDTAILLYDGPWVAERLAAFETFGVTEADMDRSVAAITMGGGKYSAVDLFQGIYKLEALKRRADAEWAKCDLLLLPSAPTTYTVEQMLADPVTLNSRLGTYTNFFNLLGLSAIAVPSGFRADGLPMGVTLAARSFQDEALVPIADRLHRAAASGMGIDKAAAIPPLGASPASITTKTETCDLIVVGAHLSGMALNRELAEVGATLKARAHTLPSYRLFLLPGTVPPKPGLLHQPGFAGPGMDVEIWTLDAADFGRFVEKIPSPLGVGKIMLEDGSKVSGFLCEPWAIEGAEEITHFGGWRQFIAARQAEAATR